MTNEKQTKCSSLHGNAWLSDRRVKWFWGKNNPNFHLSKFKCRSTVLTLSKKEQNGKKKKSNIKIEGQVYKKGRWEILTSKTLLKY